MTPQEINRAQRVAFVGLLDVIADTQTAIDALPTFRDLPNIVQMDALTRQLQIAIHRLREAYRL